MNRKEAAGVVFALLVWAAPAWSQTVTLNPNGEGGQTGGTYVGWNWNRDGSSIAGGDETLISGFPYVIPGARVTWIFVHPRAKVLVGTDTGALYQFDIP